MIDLDELAKRKNADLTRTDQARERMERLTVALHAFLPGFMSELIAQFIAEVDNYNGVQLSQSAKIEVDTTNELSLKLSRLAIAPYATAVITCVQRDSIADLICTVEGYGLNGEAESRPPFHYTLKVRGIGIGVYERDQLSFSENIVRAVMQQFLYYLL